VVRVNGDRLEHEGEAMDQNRAAVMQKARERRSRRAALRRAKGSASRAAGSPGARTEGLPEKLSDLTQGAIEKVGELMKSTAQTIRDAVT
jgi:hypothetical protein